MRGLVYGVGVSTSGKYKISHNYHHTTEYTLWKNMLRRCYNSSEQIKCPTYRGCIVSENFKIFQYFAEWCNSQVGFGNKGWQLDKDIIGDGKLYSEDTCCFVPREINQLLTDARSIRGKWPIGVTHIKHMNKFEASVTKLNKRCVLGYYKSSDEAHMVYRVEKEQHVKCMAALYQEDLDSRVFSALLKWEVS